MFGCRLVLVQARDEASHFPNVRAYVSKGGEAYFKIHNVVASMKGDSSHCKVKYGTAQDAASTSRHAMEVLQNAKDAKQAMLSSREKALADKAAKEAEQKAIEMENELKKILKERRKREIKKQKSKNGYLFATCV